MHESFSSLLQTSSILELLKEFNAEAQNLLDHLAQINAECAAAQLVAVQTH